MIETVTLIKWIFIMTYVVIANSVSQHWWAWLGASKMLWQKDEPNIPAMICGVFWFASLPVLLVISLRDWINIYNGFLNTHYDGLK